MKRLLEDAFWHAPIPRRERFVVMTATLVAMSILILARLDAYALWDDEANTALYGEAVWRTGDTSAVHGHNVIAFRNGVELDENLHNRLVAPLPYYVEAIFVRDTRSAWWARLPFALAGIATLFLLLRWLGKLDATRRTWAISMLALVGNISLILFARQARYYALSMLLAVGIAYCYVHRDRTRQLVVGSALAIALLATHYLAYAGLAVALALDYAIWGRTQTRVSWRALAAVAASQIVAAAVILSIWYPLGKEIARATEGSWIVNRLELWLAMLRDLNTCEFGVGLAMLAAPLLYRRDRVLVRLLVAIVVATGVVTVFSPQPDGSRLADIRYIAFLLPACVVLSARVVDALPIRAVVAILIAVVAFHTTALHRLLAFSVPERDYKMPLRSTTAAYIGELIDPPPSSFAQAAAWLDANARAGDSAIAIPPHAAYSLMFHAPKLVYGWQFTSERAAALKLPPIQAMGLVPPDWIVSFEGATPRRFGLSDRTVVRYEPVAELPVSGTDASRAELYWHRFAPLEAPHRVTIWRRVDYR